MGLLPDGVKFIYCVRDPRDAAVEQKDPNQILWLVYEDVLRDPKAMVHTVAGFLGVRVEDGVVASIAQAMEHSELQRRWGQSFGPLLPPKEKAVPGVYAQHFSQEQLVRFRREVLTPAISAGVRFGHEVLTDLKP